MGRYRITFKEAKENKQTNSSPIDSDDSQYPNVLSRLMHCIVCFQTKIDCGNMIYIYSNDEKNTTIKKRNDSGNTQNLTLKPIEEDKPSMPESLSVTWSSLTTEVEKNRMLLGYSNGSVSPVASSLTLETVGGKTIIEEEERLNRESRLRVALEKERQYSKFLMSRLEALSGEMQVGQGEAGYEEEGRNDFPTGRLRSLCNGEDRTGVDFKHEGTMRNGSFLRMTQNISDEYPLKTDPKELVEPYGAEHETHRRDDDECQHSGFEFSLSCTEAASDISELHDEEEALQSLGPGTTEKQQSSEKEGLIASDSPNQIPVAEEKRCTTATERSTKYLEATKNAKWCHPSEEKGRSDVNDAISAKVGSEDVSKSDILQVQDKGNDVCSFLVHDVDADVASDDAVPADVATDNDIGKEQEAKRSDKVSVCVTHSILDEKKEIAVARENLIELLDDMRNEEWHHPLEETVKEKINDSTLLQADNVKLSIVGLDESRCTQPNKSSTESYEATIVRRGCVMNKAMELVAENAGSWTESELDSFAPHSFFSGKEYIMTIEHHSSASSEGSDKNVQIGSICNGSSYKAGNLCDETKQCTTSTREKSNGLCKVELNEPISAQHIEDVEALENILLSNDGAVTRSSFLSTDGCSRSVIGKEGCERITLDNCRSENGKEFCETIVLDNSPCEITEDHDQVIEVVEHCHEGVDELSVGGSMTKREGLYTTTDGIEVTQEHAVPIVNCQVSQEAHKGAKCNRTQRQSDDSVEVSELVNERSDAPHEEECKDSLCDNEADSLCDHDEDPSCDPHEEECKDSLCDNEADSFCDHDKDSSCDDVENSSCDTEGAVVTTDWYKLDDDEAIRLFLGRPILSDDSRGKSSSESDLSRDADSACSGGGEAHVTPHTTNGGASCRGEPVCDDTYVHASRLEGCMNAERRKEIMRQHGHSSDFDGHANNEGLHTKTTVTWGTIEMILSNDVGRELGSVEESGGVDLFLEDFVVEANIEVVLSGKPVLASPNSNENCFFVDEEVEGGILLNKKSREDLNVLSRPGGNDRKVTFAQSVTVIEQVGDTEGICYLKSFPYNDDALDDDLPREDIRGKRTPVQGRRKLYSAISQKFHVLERIIQKRDEHMYEKIIFLYTMQSWASQVANTWRKRQTAIQTATCGGGGFLSRFSGFSRINAVEAAASLRHRRSNSSLKTRCAYKQLWEMTRRERTKSHPGFANIQKFSLLESTAVNGKFKKENYFPWENRIVKQRFLFEKSLERRNWFGIITQSRGNTRSFAPVCHPQSMQLMIPEHLGCSKLTLSLLPTPGEWEEGWYTTWQSRRDNPNTLIECEKDETAIDLKHRDDNGIVPEIGNIITVRLKIGENVTRVDHEHSSRLRRSRWRKKFFPNGTFPY